MVKRLGVEGCLAKPVLPHELTAALQAYPQVKTLLVVDDDIGVVQLVQRTLENTHPQVTIRRAYSGQQAGEMMQAAAPDLVLLDLAMPGMSGFEVISIMKADPTLQALPIILLTATRYIHAEDEICESLQIHRQGGLKPMEVLKLLNCIAQTVST
jgi:CheY-like chemotaxis protein